MRCMQFWYKILMNEVYEGRLLRKFTGGGIASSGVV